MSSSRALWIPLPFRYVPASARSAASMERERRPTRAGVCGSLSAILRCSCATDFLICKTCCVYVAATMGTGSDTIATVNVNVFDERGPFLRGAEPVSYFRESVEQRKARRLMAWMPAEVRS